MSLEGLSLADLVLSKTIVIGDTRSDAERALRAVSER